MPADISIDALKFLLARAGLAPSESLLPELPAAYAGVAAMAERVRRPRTIMAEPAHRYGFADEDLPR